jgi:hypothetical protein
MPIDMFEGLPELAKDLRESGFDVRHDVFRGQVGLLVSERGKTIPPADFFPLWELNQNLHLVGRRDFTAIKAKRPPTWSPVLSENNRSA